MNRLILLLVIASAMPSALARTVVNDNGDTCLLDAHGNMVGCQNPNRVGDDTIFFQELPNTGPTPECTEAYEKINALELSLQAAQEDEEANAEAIDQLNKTREELDSDVRRFCD